MGDRGVSAKEWVLDVDLKSLMEYTGCKSVGLDVQNIYLSDVALAVHISCSNTSSGSDTTKEYLGRLLRFLSGCAEEVGMVLPVLCVIDAPESVSAIDKTVLNQWAADQDWHRGDFSIAVVSDGRAAGEVIRETLGSIATAWPSVKLEPRDLDAIVNSFESERRSRRVSADHASLLAAIAVALREGTDAPISKWLDERLDDVRQLLAGREKDEQ